MLAANMSLQFFIQPIENVVIIKIHCNIHNVSNSDSGGVLNVFTMHTDLAAVLAEVGAIYRIRLAAQHDVVLNLEVQIGDTNSDPVTQGLDLDSVVGVGPGQGLSGHCSGVSAVVGGSSDGESGIIELQNCRLFLGVPFPSILSLLLDNYVQLLLVVISEHNFAVGAQANTWENLVLYKFLFAAIDHSLKLLVQPIIYTLIIKIYSRINNIIYRNSLRFFGFSSRNPNFGSRLAKIAAIYRSSLTSED
mmetsp:Transcript_13327/g.18366  ORF Transcript_13327/g.18366 Transcript_13327/m.18366 type:complete len:248 (-) Transcript_13327:2156-2899(-)